MRLLRRSLAIAVCGLIACPLSIVSSSAQPPAPAVSQIAQVRGDQRAGGWDGDSIRWRACPAIKPYLRGMQCARFIVPWDWRRPNGRTYSLAMTRLAALPDDRPNRYKPSLFVNPGGPGVSGTALVDAFRDYPKLRKNFYIVGWDPRGVPMSTPLLKKCVDKPLDLPVTGAFSWPTVAEEYATEANMPECVRRNRGQLRSVGTNNVVRDLDAMRQAVGDQRLTYLGYSYGTTIGRLYAMQYRAKIRALVLDGIVMPYNAMTWYAKSSVNASNAAWDFTLRDTPQLVRDLGDDVSDYLQTATIDLGSGAVDRWAFWRLSLQTASTLDPGTNYTFLVCSLADAAHLPTTGCPPTSLSVRSGEETVRRIRARVAEDDGDDPIMNAVRCTDYIRRPSSNAVASAFVAAGARPQTSANIFSRSLECTGWPSLNPVAATLSTVRTSTPPLFVNGIADQATGYWGATQTARYFAGNRFITVDTGMHGLFGVDANPCIRNPVEHYLLTTRLPTRNLYCRHAK